MPVFTEYTTGTPCWTDVTSPDLDRTVSFYGGLFGWEAERDPRPEAGGYVMFTKEGKYVAAGSPPPRGAEGVPPHWSTFIASDDVDATAKRVTRRGRDAADGADGCLRIGPHGACPGPGRRRLRGLGGEGAHRRRARDRAGHDDLERERHARSRARVGVLQAGVRLRDPGVGHGRRAALSRCCRSRARGSPGCCR